MRAVLRWGGIVVGVLGAIVLVVIAGIWLKSNAEIDRMYEVDVGPMQFPAPDSSAIARGRHLADAVALCGDCHGADMAGTWLMDEPSFARLRAANITPGGVTADYTDADWYRLLVHGVKPDGRSAVVMPSESYRYLSMDDLTAIVAYIRSLPAREGGSEGFLPGPVGRALLAAGPLRAVLVARRIAADTMPMPVTAIPDSTAAYGYYLAQTAGCIGCHGSGLSGGPIPGGDPASPPAANITPGGMASWDLATFDRAMRQGVGPAGREINPDMPRRGHMTEVEMVALWKYLRSLPAREFGGGD